MSTKAPNLETSLRHLRRRAGVGAKITPLLIIGYWIASVLGHLQISLWLVQERESDLLGSYKLADFLPHAGALLLAAVVIWQALRALHGANRAGTLAAWAAWLIAVVLVDRFLIYSFPEYLHYPQYALLAWMIARFVDPARTAFAVGPVLLAVTALGIADEALQYTWITISYSNYLDFNDFLLNLLGGAAGLLLHYGFAPGPQSSHPANTVGRGYVPDAATTNTRQSENAVGRGAVPDATTPNVPSATPGRPTQTRQSENTVGRGYVPDESTPNIPSATPGRPTPIRDLDNLPATAARRGLLGFAWLGTGMLLAIAALQTAQTDPQLLQPLERQPSYNTWIPGPRAGRYYVLDPVTGTLILVGLGALASAAPVMRQIQHRTPRRPRRADLRKPANPKTP